MIEIKKQYGQEFEKNIDFLKVELKGLRTGRANSAMVENIVADVYGTMTPIQHIASISVPDAKTILISPWDKSIIKEIEKAIIIANIGINPVNEGSAIRLSVPTLTEENRKNLVKVLGQRIEQSRISIRNVRDKIKDEISKQEKEKEITEDDRYSLIEELDEITKDYGKVIDELASQKEKEIMTI